MAHTSHDSDDLTGKTKKLDSLLPVQYRAYHREAAHTQGSTRKECLTFSNVAVAATSYLRASIEQTQFTLDNEDILLNDIIAGHDALKDVLDTMDEHIRTARVLYETVGQWLKNEQARADILRADLEAAIERLASQPEKEINGEPTYILLSESPSQQGELFMSSPLTEHGRDLERYAVKARCIDDMLPPEYRVYGQSQAHLEEAPRIWRRFSYVFTQVAIKPAAYLNASAEKTRLPLEIAEEMAQDGDSGYENLDNELERTTKHVGLAAALQGLPEHCTSFEQVNIGLLKKLNKAAKEKARANVGNSGEVQT